MKLFESQYYVPADTVFWIHDCTNYYLTFNTYDQVQICQFKLINK